MKDDSARSWYLRKSHFATGFILHCLSGGITVVVHYGLMYLCLSSGVHPIVSTSIGFVGGATSRFLMAYYHIFTPSSDVPIAALRFSTTIFVQFVVNGLLMGALLSLSVPVWYAQVLTTVSMTMANYLAYRYWVFR